MEEGRVAVNGEVVSRQGLVADPEKDRITCDGKAVKIPSKIYILLNKPKGILTTCADDRGRKTVIDIVKHINQRIFPVGRLDFNTTGLLILTNDGELAAKMTHPSSGVVKTYLAKVRGQVAERTLKKMLAGITMEGVRYRFREVSREKGTSKNSYLKIRVAEGKKHIVKKLCEALGHPVSKLSRVAFGTLKLSGLEPGYYRHLSQKEVRLLTASPRPNARPKKT